MQITKNILIVSLVSLSLICWAGCGVFRIRPAEDIRTLAVFNFEGKYGEAVSAYLCAGLDETGRFEVSTVSSIDQYPYDNIDSPEFLSLLQELKADGLVAGRVIAGIEDIKGIDKVPARVGTGLHKQVRDPFGKGTRTVEIMRTVLRPYPYNIRRASFTVLYRMVSVKTGRIVAAGKVSEIYEEKFGGKQECDMVSSRKLSHLPPKDITMKSLSKRAAAKLIEKIVPRI